MAPSRNVTCFIHLFFLLIDDSSFIRGYTNPPVLKFMNSCFFPYVDMTSQDPLVYINV